MLRERQSNLSTGNVEMSTPCGYIFEHGIGADVQQLQIMRTLAECCEPSHRTAKSVARTLAPYEIALLTFVGWLPNPDTSKWQSVLVRTADIAKAHIWSPWRRMYTAHVILTLNNQYIWSGWWWNIANEESARLGAPRKDLFFEYNSGTKSLPSKADLIAAAPYEYIAQILKDNLP